MANQFTISYGYRSNAGCIGYLIANKSDDNSKYWLNTVDGIEVGMVYSVYYDPGENETNAFGNRDCIGKVIEVNSHDKSITVDNIWKGTVNSLSTSYIWFPFEDLYGGDKPLGNSTAAIGYDCKASQIGSFACGALTYAIGKYAHTEGVGTTAVYASHAEGKETSAFGQGSHAEGYRTSAGGTDKNYCHAEGRYTEAKGYASHSAGRRCYVSSDYAWGWNWDASNKYEVSGEERVGTFNINPKNGISGFYIGDKTMSDYILSGIDETSTELKTQISEVSSQTSEISTVKNDVSELSAYSYMPNKTAEKFIRYEANIANYFINRDSGQPTYNANTRYACTDLIPLDNIIDIVASYAAHYSTAGWAIYNEDQSQFATRGKTEDPKSSNELSATNETISKADLLQILPSAKFIRFSTSRASTINSFLVHTEDNINIDSAIRSIEDDISYMSKIAMAKLPIGIDLQISDNVMLLLANGNIKDYNTHPEAIATRFIDVDILSRQLKVSGTAQWSTCLYCIYDANQNFMQSFGYNDFNPNTGKRPLYTAIDEVVDIAQLKKQYPQFKYIRFASLDKTKFAISKYEMCSQNVLAGRTYVIAGDSFSYDTTAIRSYGNIIAERNGMNAINIGTSGSYMHSNSADDPKSFAQTILPAALDSVAKADYMTICYGINEMSLEIGTKEDNSLDTLWGSWNVALSSIFDVNPAIKLGIIIPDATTTQNMHNALSAIAQWWGIPYLDLKDGPTAMIDGRTDQNTINPYVVAVRNSVFRTSATNIHPTQKAQEFRSTIVENFLRSM